MIGGAKGIGLGIDLGLVNQYNRTGSQSYIEPEVLDSLVGVWSAYGMTNDSPNRSTIKNKLSNKGGDFVISNAAFKLNSGFGKYEDDFTTWYGAGIVIGNGVGFKIERETTSWWGMSAYGDTSGLGSFTIKVTNCHDLFVYRYKDEDGNWKDYPIESDGIYTLPASGAKDDKDNYRFFNSNPNATYNGLTVEQIPSHAGALCLDGINDFGKVTGMPVYKDYTIVADYERLKIGYIEDKGTPAILSKSYTAGQGAFLMNLISSTGDYMNTYTFGNANSAIFNDLNKKIYYQSKYKMQGFDITIGSGVDGDSLWLGVVRDNDSRFFNGAIYSLMSFPYSMSEFLIERQLKKHKLGTLYPDMVEFRPVIKTNTEWEYLEIYQGDNRLYSPAANDDKTGIYLEENSEIGIYVKPIVGKKVSKIVYNGTTYTNFEVNSNGFYYIIVPITKSPQKIGITIEQDENYVQWNPVVNITGGYSHVTYSQLNDNGVSWNKLEIGEYIPIGKKVLIQITLDSNVDEISSYNVIGLTDIVTSNNDTFITGNVTSESPQKINITIDEYIRYEDIVQPYPSLFTLIDYDTEEVYSWGSKLKIGTKFKGNVINLLPNMYEWQGSVLYNGEPIYWNTVPGVVSKEMTFSWSKPFKYLIDNNEPKVILSPSRLRIPNSSYKLLGYIPDISGHGNHGVIHNSAYAEGSGVNEDGSYQFDGVDDFVTIPTLSSGGKQVLMKVNWQNDYDVPGYMYDSNAGEYRNYIIKGNKEQIAYENASKTYIDGILNANLTSGDLKDITHNITSQFNNASGIPYIGCRYSLENFLKMSLYDFMLFDNISTDDKIKELNEYVGIEAKVELPPYYWDAYGKTNLDADKATIQQRGVAVGDYDITNYNHAYDKMSGFGGYEFAKFNSSEWININRADGIEIIKRSGYSFTAKRIGTGQYFYDFQNRSTTVLNKSLTVKAVSDNNTYIRWEYKYRTAEKPDIDSTLLLVRQAMTPNVPITVTLPYKTEEEKIELGVTEGSDSYLFYFDPSDIPVNREYTVEMLPLYPNSLIYDGVNDYSENVNIPILDDFTFLVKASLPNGFTGSGGNIAKKGGYNQVISGGYDFIYALDSSVTEANKNSYWSFGGSLLVSTGAINPPLIGYMTKTNVNGVPIIPSTAPSIEGIIFSKWSGYMSMIFYKAILYPKTIPLLQINFLKNLMEKDEIIDLNNPIFIQE